MNIFQPHIIPPWEILWNQPTQDLLGAFETGDKRKSVSIGYWTGSDYDGVVRAIPYCAKYKPLISAPDDRCGDNFPILRYSDVLLMYAEAYPSDQPILTTDA